MFMILSWDALISANSEKGNNPVTVWEQFRLIPDVAELADFACLLLGLVVNQAGNEHTFSDLKIKKTCLWNRLGVLKLKKCQK